MFLTAAAGSPATAESAAQRCRGRRNRRRRHQLPPIPLRVFGTNGARNHHL